MDEIQESAVSTGADDWDDISFEDVAPESEEVVEMGATAEEPKADQPEEQKAEETPAPETEKAPETEAEPKADPPFVLKHLDEVKEVNRDEVIELAQKGLDYDRIRQKYDAGKEAIEWHAANADSVRWLEEIAKEQGMTFGQLVDSTRAQIMANRTGQPLSVCQGIVANERKAAELEAQKKALESKNSASDAEAAAKAKMEADIQAFTKAYPEQARDPKALPKEVWDAVHNGDTLLNAYRAYENKQLKAQLEQQKADAERRAQEEKNKARSTGSQSSQGKKAEMDAFDALWYDGN